LSFLGKGRAAYDESQAHGKHDDFHLDPLLDVGLNYPERAPGTYALSLTNTRKVDSFLYLTRYGEPRPERFYDRISMPIALFGASRGASTFFVGGISCRPYFAQALP
jgi:hypothetical protein